MRKFMSLPEEYSSEKSEFVILPIKYEKDVTYGKGASLGPDAIIKASQHLEYYDEQFDIEGFEKGIRLLEPLELNDLKPKEMVETIFTTKCNYKDKFVII